MATVKKTVSVELPTGETATVAIVKELRNDPEQVYIYDLCKEEPQEAGDPILITLQQDCFVADVLAPFTLTAEEIEELG